MRYASLTKSPPLTAPTSPLFLILNTENRQEKNPLVWAYSAPLESKNNFQPNQMPHSTEPNATFNRTKCHNTPINKINKYINICDK